MPEVKPSTPCNLREVTSLPTSREQAIARGEKAFFSGKPCRNGHVAARYVGTAHSVGKCVVCSAIHRETLKSNDPDYSKRHYQENREIYLERAKLSAASNPEQTRQNKRAWKSRHSDQNKAINKAHKLANPEYYAAKQRFRNAWLRTRRLPGFDKELEAFYGLCPPGFHVDHIVPLKGKTVCGLHVPWNLQYLPATENIKKGNRLMDDLEA